MEPISIDFLINSTEVAHQSQRVRQSLAGVDSSVARTKLQFKELTNAQLLATQSTNELSHSFRQLAQFTAAYFTLQGANNIIGQIATIRGEYQKTEIAFKTMLGSQEKANALIAEMTQLAAITPFNFQEINQGAKQLLAYQTPVDQVSNTLERLGNIAAGLSVPLDRLITVFGQVKAKGKLMGDDLKQFTEAGVPMIAQLAQVMGVAESEVSKLISSGTVGFDKVQKAIENMTNKGGMFHNLMREQSKSIPGQIANIQDAFERAFNEIGQSQEGLISSTLSGVQSLVDNYKTVLDVLGGLVVTYGAYRASLMAVSALESIRAKTIATELAGLSSQERVAFKRLLVIEKQAAANVDLAKSELLHTEQLFAKIATEKSELALKKEKLVTIAAENAQLLTQSKHKLQLAQVELQAAIATGQASKIAKAQKSVEIAQNEVVKNQELASISRQNAIAANQALVNAQTQLGNTGRAVKIAGQKVEIAQEALNTATKNASAMAETRLTLTQHLRTAATALATKAQALLNATMLSNPIVAVTAAVAALVYAYIKLENHTDANAKATEQFNQQKEKEKKLIDDLKNKTQELSQIISDQTATEFEQLKAYQQLQQMYPKLLQNMDLHTFKLQENADMTKKFNQVQNNINFDNQRKEIALTEERIKNTVDKINTLQQSLSTATERSYDHIIGAINRANKELEVQNQLLSNQKKKLQEELQTHRLANLSNEEKIKYYQQQEEKLKNIVNYVKTGNRDFLKTVDYTTLAKYNISDINKLLGSMNVGYLNAQLNDIQKKMGNIKNTLSGNHITKNKSYWENQKQEASDKLSALDTSQKGSKLWQELTKKIREADTELEKYNTSQKRSTSVLKNQKKALDDLIKAENDIAKMRMSNHQKDIANIREKYAELRNQAKKENQSQGVLARIDKAEATEIGIAQYQERTTQLIEQLEREKKIYNLYETYRQKTELNSISNTFKNHLNGFENFKQRLQAEIDQIENQMPEQGKTALEQQRLELLRTLLVQWEEDKINAQREAQAQALSEHLSFNEKKLKLEQDYQKQKTAIETLSNQNDKNEKLHNLQQWFEQQQNQLHDEQYQRQNAQQKWLDDLTEYSKKELLIRISTIKEYLKTAQGLTQQQTQQLQEQLTHFETIFAQANNNVELRENQLLKAKEILLQKIANNKIKGSQATQQELEKIQEINRELALIESKKIRQISHKLKEVTQITDAFSYAFRNVNQELAQAVAQIADMSNNIDNMLISIAEGNWAGAIAGGISILGQIIDWFQETDNQQEHREKKQQEQELIRLQAEYNKQLRERILLEQELNDKYQSGAEKMAEKANAIKKNMKEVEKEIWEKLNLLGNTTGTFDWIKDYNGKDNFKKWVEKQVEKNSVFKIINLTTNDIANGWQAILEKIKLAESKGLINTEDAKKMIEELNKLQNEYNNLTNLYQELEEAKQQAITGTTADTLAQSIANGLASGKRSFEDFAKDIEGFLKNAIISSMSHKVLGKHIQALQDYLYNISSDGTITAEEYAKFREMYMKIVELGKHNIEMMNQAGIEMLENTDQSNSLKGAIRGITAEQADLLAGQFGGLRITQLETNEILKSSAQYQMQACGEMIAIQKQIEVNTGKTAYNTRQMLEVLTQILNNHSTTNPFNNVGL